MALGLLYSSMYTVAGLMHGPFRIGTTIDSITMSDNMFGTSILYQIKQNTFKIFKVHSIFFHYLPIVTT